MKKILLLVILCFIVSGCSKGYLKEISYDDYNKLIENKETFILEVMRTACSACTTFKPKLEEVSEEYKVEVKYIDTDKLSEEKEEELFVKLGITGTPTVIFYKDGIEESTSTRIKGSVSKEKIISKFKVNDFIK